MYFFLEWNWDRCLGSWTWAYETSNIFIHQADFKFGLYNSTDLDFCFSQSSSFVVGQLLF